MKITKARLKEIINEELERVMDDSRNLAGIAEREQEIVSDLSILEKKKQTSFLLQLPHGNPYTN